MKDTMDRAIATYWGAEHLTRWPEGILRDVQMPLASKRFLADIGLPSPGRAIFGWEFKWELKLPIFKSDRKLRILGWTYEAHPILIDEDRAGRIIWKPVECERYVNASAEQFAGSLVMLDKYRLNAERTMNDPHDRAAVLRNAAALRQTLKKIDDTAIADQNSLWSAIVQDIRLLA